MATLPYRRDRAARGAVVLSHADHRSVAACLEADPVATCMVAARFEIGGMDRLRLGGQFWAVAGDEPALAFAGPNLVALAGRERGLDTLADTLGPRGRIGASVTGRAELVLPLWRRLENWWGPPREMRAAQPLLTCPDRPVMRGDDRLVAVRPDQLDRYFPAAVAMFREEVGSDPLGGDGGAGYRGRVASLIAGGRAFARWDGDTVVYKAEIGALSRRVALIQGIWVHPRWRGRGIAAPATAALVDRVLAGGRLPSLYVNAHNVAARAAYARVGFRQLATFATVLL